MKTEIEQMEFVDVAASTQVIYDNDALCLDSAIERALTDVVSAVARYQKKGEIAIKLVFNSLNDRQIKIGATITAKAPIPSTPEKIAYVDKAGRLCADDPSQKPLPFSEVKNVG